MFRRDDHRLGRGVVPVTQGHHHRLRQWWTVGMSERVALYVHHVRGLPSREDELVSEFGQPPQEISEPNDCLRGGCSSSVRLPPIAVDSGPIVCDSEFLPVTVRDREKSRPDIRPWLLDRAGEIPSRVPLGLVA